MPSTAQRQPSCFPQTVGGITPGGHMDTCVHNSRQQGQSPPATHLLLQPRCRLPAHLDLFSHHPEQSCTVPEA